MGMHSQFLVVGAIFSLFWNTAIAAEEGVVTESTSHIIRLTDHGLEPRALTTHIDDKIVFFVNDSSEALTTMEISFGQKITHCASSNLKIGEDGVIRSVRPFGPRDFATICVHEPGEYAFNVYGLTGSPNGVPGKITVLP